MSDSQTPEDRSIISLPASMEQTLTPKGCVLTLHHKQLGYLGYDDCGENLVVEDILPPLISDYRPFGFILEMSNPDREPGVILRLELSSLTAAAGILKEAGIRTVVCGYNPDMVRHWIGVPTAETREEAMRLLLLEP